MEEAGWQLDLVQLRRLMRNEVTNHERIRSRVLSLQERYIEGEMGESSIGWESWAVTYFAYSARHLRYLSAPHPLSLNKWEKQQEEAQAKLAREQRKRDAQLSQMVWDEIQYDVKRSQVAWDLYQQEQATKQVRIQAREKERTKNAGKPKSRAAPAVPAAETARVHLAEIDRLNRANRVDLGRQFVELRELANNRKLGRNEKGQYWRFNPWCVMYIGRSRRDIYKCIDEYERSINSGSQDTFDGLRIVK